MSFHKCALRLRVTRQRPSHQRSIINGWTTGQRIGSVALRPAVDPARIGLTVPLLLLLVSTATVTVISLMQAMMVSAIIPLKVVKCTEVMMQVKHGN